MNYDYIIIYAFLIILLTAYHFLLKIPHTKVLILEKKSVVAHYQSGRNSGRIHIGIYYKTGSLNAQNCIEDYNSIVQFAERCGIRYDPYGKTVVTANNQELLILDSIYKRDLENVLQNFNL